MYKNAEDESVICPYNRYHVISKLKIQKHLIKCKKNHPEVKLATCFYNYTHRLRPEDMLEHYEICPYKARVEGARYEGNSGCSSLQGDNSQQYVSYPGSLKSLSVTKKPEDFLSKTLTGATSRFRNFRSLMPDKYPMPKVIKKEIKQCDVPETWDDDMEENVVDDSDANDSVFDVDDDLEPLPLPKTTSKAFTCAFQNSAANNKTQDVKFFGRGKNFLSYDIKEMPRIHHNLLPDVSDIDSDVSKDISSKVFLSRAYTSCSELSDTSDECTTFKSDDISVAFDEEGFILKGLDYYVKI